MKPKGFNRNMVGGKRPHKGIRSMPTECIKNLSKRIMWESKQLQKYINRVGNQK